MKIMNQKYKKLLLIIILISIIKFLLSLLITTPSIFTDEYIYMKTAQNIFQNLEISLHGIKTIIYPPLYTIILSISFIFKEAKLAYLFMKIINSILSTLIIMPSFLLAKEFVDEKKSIIIATIIAILPMNFVFSAFIMSENLFYTLYLSSIYLIYKLFKEKNRLYAILSGIFIGLTYLTKFAGISLIMIVGVLFLHEIYKKNYTIIKKTIITVFTGLIVISPWLIRNGINFGFTLKGILGQYSLYSKEIQTINQKSYLLISGLWIFLNLGYLILASGIIPAFFISSNIKKYLKENKTKLLTLITIISILIVLIGTAQAGKRGLKEDTDIPGLLGRPIGRYIDTTLPIMMILSLIIFYKNENVNKSKKLITILIIPIIILCSQLLYFTLFPVNNISLTLLGSLSIILSILLNQKTALILITIAMMIILLIINFINLKSKKYTYLLIIFFIITNILAYGSIIYNIKENWENHEQIKLSEWLSKNIDKKSIILIDEENCGIFNKTSDVLCTQLKSMTLIDLWITNPTFINNINSTKADYIITRKQLNLKLIKETETKIRVYKNETIN